MMRRRGSKDVPHTRAWRSSADFRGSGRGLAAFPIESMPLQKTFTQSQLAAISSIRRLIDAGGWLTTGWLADGRWLRLLARRKEEKMRTTSDTLELGGTRRIMLRQTFLGNMNCMLLGIMVRKSYGRGRTIL